MLLHKWFTEADTIINKHIKEDREFFKIQLHSSIITGYDIFFLKTFYWLNNVHTVFTRIHNHLTPDCETIILN